jgi:2-iminobutanoate/2-iminopropanoate deaminase
MKSEIKKISLEGAPAPGGHYTPAIAHNGTLYISGQLPINPDGTHTYNQPFEVQARAALNNVLGLVKATGGDAHNLLKVTVYIVGVEHWKTFNQLYIEIMGDSKPARAVVPVPALHYDYLIEIDGVAAIG